MNTKGLFFCGVLMVSISTSIFCMENPSDKDGNENVEQLLELVKPWIGQKELIEEHRTKAQETKSPVMIDLDETTKAICNSGDDISLYIDSKGDTLSYELFFKIMNDLNELKENEMASNFRPRTKKTWGCIAS